MTRSLAATLAAVLCAAGLAACGDSGSSSSSATATVPTTKLASTVTTPLQTPYTGTYAGRASDGRAVHFSYKDGKILDFTMGGNVHFREGNVIHNTFLVRGAARGGGLYWQGAWTSSHGVEGIYHYDSQSTGKPVVTGWTAQSYARGATGPVGPSG